MRRSASEIIRNLETRIARLEKSATSRLPLQINSTVNYFLSALNKSGIYAEGMGNGDYSSLELNKPNLKFLISQGSYTTTGEPVDVYIEGILTNRNKAPTIMFRLYDRKTRKTLVFDNQQQKQGISKFLKMRVARLEKQSRRREVEVDEDGNLVDAFSVGDDYIDLDDVADEILNNDDFQEAVEEESDLDYFDESDLDLNILYEGTPSRKEKGIFYFIVEESNYNFGVIVSIDLEGEPSIDYVSDMADVWRTFNRWT